MPTRNTSARPQAALEKTEVLNLSKEERDILDRMIPDRIPENGTAVSEEDAQRYRGWLQHFEAFSKSLHLNVCYRMLKEIDSGRDDLTYIRDDLKGDGYGVPEDLHECLMRMGEASSRMEGVIQSLRQDIGEDIV